MRLLITHILLDLSLWGCYRHEEPLGVTVLSGRGLARPELAKVA